MLTERGDANGDTLEGQSVSTVVCKCIHVTHTLHVHILAHT